ncbi:MAG: 23S rRNA (pseudouridine(1915)-N(3))-methyltransferase RlmH [Gammaproteobacteria bacterium]|nr:23S rRNA (pseudouridine(1915)-N(3))-methyltransferase RlmH [Gammaproteobacteria bacterium]
MKIRLIVAGTRMPAWVTEGYHHYARRLSGTCTLELVEVATGRRGPRAPPDRARAEEGRRLRAAVPKGSRIVALDEHGEEWSTSELARRLEGWMLTGDDLALLVGGPDGLDGPSLAAAAERWALSRLTLPHGLVRIVVAEQLYRAVTLLQGHPYHRG